MRPPRSASLKPLRPWIFNLSYSRDSMPVFDFYCPFARQRRPPGRGAISGRGFRRLSAVAQQRVGANAFHPPVLRAVGVAEHLRLLAPSEVQSSDRIILDALSHLILSDHGKLESGSPVEPKLPEAAALHYIENLDATLEMMRAIRATSKVVSQGWNRAGQAVLNKPSLPSLGRVLNDRTNL